MALDPATLHLRYPAFAAVDDATLTYWSTDGARFVDASWPIVEDHEPAQLAVAAHNMLDADVAGIGDSDIAALLASGVTDFQSGGHEGFRLSLSPAPIQQAPSGGHEATRPGQEYFGCSLAIRVALASPPRARPVSMAASTALLGPCPTPQRRSRAEPSRRVCVCGEPCVSGLSAAFYEAVNG